MSNVIDFPGRNERDWRVIEEAIRNACAKAALPGPATDWMIRDMKPRLDAMALSWQPEFDVPAPCMEIVERVVARFTEFLHEATNQAIWQIVNLEVELCAALHGPDGPETSRPA